MSQPASERTPRPEAGSERRMWKLELLGLVNGGIFLAALAAFILSYPLTLSPFRLAALCVLVACLGFFLWLRRRFWTALNGELRRRKRAEQIRACAYITSGTLTPAQGQALIEAAEAIQANLCSGLGA